MNIIIYTLIFLGIIYFLLYLTVNTSSKKISKHLRKLTFLFLIVLAIILVVGGKFLFSIPFTLLSLALVKLKGFSIFQLISLYKLIQTLRRSGRFSFNQSQNIKTFKKINFFRLNNFGNITCGWRQVFIKYTFNFIKPSYS